MRVFCMFFFVCVCMCACVCVQLLQPAGGMAHAHYLRSVGPGPLATHTSSRLPPAFLPPAGMQDMLRIIGRPVEAGKGGDEDDVFESDEEEEEGGAGEGAGGVGGRGFCVGRA